MILVNQIMAACGMPENWERWEGRQSCQRRRIEAAGELERTLFIFSRFPQEHGDGTKAYEVINPSNNSLSLSLISHCTQVAQWGERDDTTLEKTWRCMHTVIEAHIEAIKILDDEKREEFLAQRLTAIQTEFPIQPSFSLPKPA